MGINTNKGKMSAPSPQFTDQQFIEGLRTDDSLVLSALYKKYYNLVLKFVVNNSGSEEAARDIYQEAVIVLYENARREDFQLSCQLQTYLYSIVRRLWLKELRRNGKTSLFRETEEEDLVDVSEETDAHAKKEAEYNQLNRSMSSLGEPCATLLSDFYVRKLSMETIAEKFGYTNADNAKNQKYKCLQRLKKNFFETTTNDTED
jgi:RNA polymerase sigma factor (sigma-70 family)